jgi:hypothetical protein
LEASVIKKQGSARLLQRQSAGVFFAPGMEKNDSIHAPSEAINFLKKLPNL